VHNKTVMLVLVVMLMMVTDIYRLKELLRNRLVECGWRDELKQYCKGLYPYYKSAYIKLSPYCVVNLIRLIVLTS